MSAFGALDILVNNAGATHVNKPMLEIGEDEYDRIFAVNVKGLFQFCQAVVPHFRESGRRRHRQYRLDRGVAAAAGTVGL